MVIFAAELAWRSFGLSAPLELSKLAATCIHCFVPEIECIISPTLEPQSWMLVGPEGRHPS